MEKLSAEARAVSMSNAALKRARAHDAGVGGLPRQPARGEGCRADQAEGLAQLSIPHRSVAAELRGRLGGRDYLSTGRVGRAALKIDLGSTARIHDTWAGCPISH